VCRQSDPMRRGGGGGVNAGRRVVMVCRENGGLVNGHSTPTPLTTVNTTDQHRLLSGWGGVGLVRSRVRHCSMGWCSRGLLPLGGSTFNGSLAIPDGERGLCTCSSQAGTARGSHARTSGHTAWHRLGRVQARPETPSNPSFQPKVWRVLWCSFVVPVW
jgi:hypothetical protein